MQNEVKKMDIQRQRMNRNKEEEWFWCKPVTEEVSSFMAKRFECW